MRRRRNVGPVADREVPDWAADFGAETWAQFFLKFVGAHPAVTVVTPATSRPHHMRDNMGAAMGRLPDEATRQRMIQLVEALPEAAGQGYVTLLDEVFTTGQAHAQNGRRDFRRSRPL